MFVVRLMQEAFPGAGRASLPELPRYKNDLLKSASSLRRFCNDQRWRFRPRLNCYTEL
jgi:hypothetical protein